MKPFLKWVGGKTQILDDVLQRFPTSVQNYHEPFVGGGSVLLGFLSRVRSGAAVLTGTVYASDLNSNLIGLYSAIQTQPDVFLRELKALADDFATCTGTVVNRKAATAEEARTSPESYYFWIRGRFNAMTVAQRAAPAGAAMMLFLNKTCFRGVYREGPRGFNVPFGNYKKPAIYDEAHIRAVSDLIQGVVFRCQAFQASFVSPGVGANDFVYLDPPYAPETGTSFVSYTADGFGLEQHTALFALCASLPAQFLMSNADVTLVREAFPAPAYKTEGIVCRRAIHSKKPESNAKEVFVTHLLEAT
jgi:DNA adenine methylase